jgi:hypothetical protein
MAKRVALRARKLASGTVEAARDAIQGTNATTSRSHIAQLGESKLTDSEGVSIACPVR